MTKVSEANRVRQTKPVEPGERFGKLTVVRPVVPAGRRPQCVTVCECGKERIADVYKLRNGRTRSCAPCGRERIRVAKTLHLEGHRFGRWTVIGRLPEHDSQHINRYWRCRCECGAERDVFGPSLRCGVSVSCGCYGAEVTGRRSTKHGGCRVGSKAPEWQCWVSMRRRCYDVTDNAYGNYGARGIVVCPQWRHDFAEFLAHVGPRPSNDHSIDRIDNDGNYAPGNVRWATRVEQANNTRSTLKVNYNGRVVPISILARECGISREGLRRRLAAGCTANVAISDMLSRK